MQADLSISCPTMQFTVQGLGHSQTVDVDPRQRVISKWGDYTSGADLKNSKSTTGEPIFANTTIPDSTFDEVVQTLQEISKILANPISDQTTGSNTSQNFVYISKSSMSTSSHVMTAGFGDWLEDGITVVVDTVEETVDDVVEFFGDVVEAIVDTVETIVNAGQEVVESILKIGVEVVDGVVNFLATIAGKAYRWLLNAEGFIIRR
jgi:hypothetical protein